MSQKFEYIDFAKGYAISTIVLYHCLQKAPLNGALQQAINLGGTGVHLFFLLSGLGLTLSAYQGDLWGFYRRRALKIWQPYALALTLSFVINLFIPLFTSSWRSWLAGLLLYQMFIDEHIEGFGGHFWFISAIIQFYLVFPLLRHALMGAGDANTVSAKRLNAFILSCFLLSLSWWLLVSFADKAHSRSWASFFLQYLWEFALGMGIGVMLRQGRLTSWLEKTRAKWLYALPLAILGFALMAILASKLGRVGKLFNDIPALVGYAAFSHFVYAFSQRYWPPLKRFFLWINGFSYSLYLIHILILELYLYGLKSAGIDLTLPGLLLFLPLALLGGWAFERLRQVKFRDV